MMIQYNMSAMENGKPRAIRSEMENPELYVVKWKTQLHGNSSKWKFEQMEIPVYMNVVERV